MGDECISQCKPLVIWIGELCYATKHTHKFRSQDIFCIFVVVDLRKQRQKYLFIPKTVERHLSLSSSSSYYFWSFNFKQKQKRNETNRKRQGFFSTNHHHRHLCELDTRTHSIPSRTYTFAFVYYHGLVADDRRHSTTPHNALSTRTNRCVLCTYTKASERPSQRNEEKNKFKMNYSIFFHSIRWRWFGGSVETRMGHRKGRGGRRRGLAQSVWIVTKMKWLRSQLIETLNNMYSI